MVHLVGQPSRYTQYLPQVLWSAETDPQQFLGRFLCIFEQILTRMPIVEQAAPLVAAEDTQITLTSATDAQQFCPYDRVTLIARTAEGEMATEPAQIRQVEEANLYLISPLRGTYQAGTVTLTDYGSLEAAIDELPTLFNPWQTPAAFLPWLASWVALSLQDTWSEYQQRKLTAEMMAIYRQRGLKRGLMTYLNIYAATDANPRIAIDDGEAIFRATWTPQQTLQLHAVAYSHSVMDQAVLLHPTAIAVDTHGHYIVADRGGEEKSADQDQDRQWPPALWRVSNTGEVPYRDMRPQPIYTDQRLQTPVAIVVDATEAGDHYYVLVQGEQNSPYPTAIYRFELAEADATRPLTATPMTIIDQAGWARAPVDMGLDISPTGEKRLIVLDQGTRDNEDPTPKLIVLEIDDDPPFTPTHEQPLELEYGVPTALAVAPDGTVLVASNQQDRAPAELIRVSLQGDRPSRPLLSSLSATENPLIAPTGIAIKEDHTVIVSDSGVRGSGEIRTLAEPAAIYQIDLSVSPPQIRPLTQQPHLVNPSKITLDHQGNVVIADQGEFLPIENEFSREWRAWPNEFGVVVLFSEQRVPLKTQRNQIRLEIATVLNDQKPGHAAWWMSSR